MGPITYFAVYVIIWWTVLFAILPIGIRTQADEDDVEPGSEPGAPVRPRHLFKLALTTLVSVVVWLGFYAVVNLDLFQFGADR